MQAKPQIIIHIGYPKTATTWFQQEFFPNVAGYTLVPRKFIKEHIIQPTPFSFSTEKVIKEIRGIYGENLILSEELLVGSIRSGGFNFVHSECMAVRLQKLFPAARIVLFIRNQPDIIASEYGQYIKDGGREPIGEFLNPSTKPQMIRLRSFQWEFLNYCHILRLYQRLFPQATSIYLYEEFAKGPPEFINNFMADHGLKLAEGPISFSSRNQRPNNLTIKRWGNHLQRFSFLFPASITSGRLSHQRIFKKKQSSGQILGKHLQIIREYYKGCNQTLAQEYGVKKIIEHKYPINIE